MKDANRKLQEVAETQQGYFTTKQAKAAGFDERNHPYHVHSGNWIRESRGIYRLASFPLPDRPDLVRCALWSRNRKDEIEGAYSHETALSLYELSDANPSKLHMTVPKRFRRMSKTPKGVVLHKADLDARDVAQRSGYRITRPLKAVLDLLEKDFDEGLLRQAVREGVNRGLITPPEIKSRQIAPLLRDRLEKLIPKGSYEKHTKVR